MKISTDVNDFEEWEFIQPIEIKAALVDYEEPGYFGLYNFDGSFIIVDTEEKAKHIFDTIGNLLTPEYMNDMDEDAESFVSYWAFDDQYLVIAGCASDRSLFDEMATMFGANEVPHFSINRIKDDYDIDISNICKAGVND